MQIAFYGKGGIGKSTISANISASLAKSGKKTLQVGCDPKYDSARLLLHDAQIVTVLDYIKRTSPDKCKLSDIIHVGAFGVHCIEAGGPEPGVGCAGRGILTTFDLLQRLGIKENGYDAVIYDVLGDVVCGGFAVPLRRDYAEKVYIVTSGEFMSIYAANNILRGLANYSADGNRAGGIIFNSRGIKDENERVSRFCETVGLPILEQFPRSELFSASEDKGMCLVEGFPESEPAHMFQKLASFIYNQTEMYRAAPLSDEELEERVLNKKRVKKIAVNINEPIEANVKNTTLYSKNLISREPLHGCAFSGAMSICIQIADAVSIAHGPNSCAHITYQSITSLSRRFLLERGIVVPVKTAPPVISTEMNESVMIFGGIEELKQKISKAKDNGASLIFVLTTCPAGIIGDDISFVSKYKGVIPILADGNIAGDYMQGVLMAYTEIAKSLIDTTCKPEDNLVNIIGEKTIANATAENYEYITEILHKLGVSVNCRFICDTNHTQVKGFKKAGLNLLAYDDYMGRSLKEFLENEFDSQFLDMPFPVGFDDSCVWLEKIGVHFDKPNEAAQIIQDYHHKYNAEISKIKPFLQGKRIMILTYNHRIDWIIQTAIDLEMELSFVGIMNFSGDNMFKSKYGDKILEFSYPYKNENRNHDIDRIKPDILLTNYSDAELDKSYFTDTIPLCPAAGFLSGIHLIRRWSEFFRMNLEEGWRKDAELYKKYRKHST